MKQSVQYKNLGLIAYKEAWDIQEQLFNEIVAIKQQNRESADNHQLITSNYLLFCEHPHVYTLGKSGQEENLLLNILELQRKKADFFKINRGGDITYHGPGQVVGYPILNLEYFVSGVKEYISKLEDAIIQVLSQYNIHGERLKGATGVWLDVNTPQKTRKICAIGVRTSRWVSMHGFAFNINTDLNYFNYINPCGFTDKKVTSLKAELGHEVDMDIARREIKESLSQIFNMTIEQ